MYLREIASVEALPLYREAARYRLTELNLWEVVRMAGHSSAVECHFSISCKRATLA
jgi:hypothetical protein